MNARHLPGLYTKLFCQPVLLESAQRMAFETALLSIMFGESAPPAPEARKQDQAVNTKRAGNLLDVQGATAIVHLDGTLDRHISAFEAECFAATDVNDVMRALQSLEQNPNVRNVLLLVNSPGGSVAGIPETAARVRSLAAKKNVFAYTEGLCCSAAYWIAAQCDQIFANESARVGSIGVYQALLNATDYMASVGRKVETIQSGTLKTAGAYWKALTDAERAHLQAQVDEIGTQFRAAVTAKRPQVPQTSMEGQSFYGSKAKAAGLIDAVKPDLASALAEFPR